jgi:nucleoside-diphosphate-sugar epimerase
MQLLNHDPSRSTVARRRVKGTGTNSSTHPVLVTGGSGFLGRYILRELVLREPDLRLRALVRNDAARSKISAFLPEAVARGAISFIRGDLTRPGLGLSQADAEALRNGLSQIWHIAAITNLEIKDTKPLYDTNVGGTATVLNFARSLRDLTRFHYVSTAYVAGRQSGPIPEGKLSQQPDFRNAYEYSKYIAEQSVISSSLPTVVYRPGIILGDSVTGYTGDDCQTVYRFVNAMMAGLARTAPSTGHKPLPFLEDRPTTIKFRLPGTASMSLNVACVDEVARLMQVLSKRAQPKQVLNITNRSDVSGDGIKRSIEQALNIRGTRFAGLTLDNPLPGERVTHRLSRPLLPYMMEPGPVWNTGRAREFLGCDWIPPMSDGKLAFLLRAHVKNQAPVA